ncbi:hypothetical protein B484DRAFT_389851, partial [Ochromonadaceae sp. CCMP2298]
VLDERQSKALARAHSLLGFHARAQGNEGYLAREDVRHAVLAVTDERPSEALLDEVLQFGRTDKGLDLTEFTAMLTSGVLHPQVALRYSPVSSKGGVVFDWSKGWGSGSGGVGVGVGVGVVGGSGATPYESSVAHNSFRFFDCDMHFPLPALNVLVRSLKGSVRDRERFFQSTVGCRRRMERKWQETPLSK